MVYGIAFCPINEETVLETLHCADSKALTEETRDRIFSDICACPKIGWAIEIISPNTICNSMFRRTKRSLNEVSMDSAIGLIKAVAERGVNVSHVFVDTVGPPEKYQAYLQRVFPRYKVTVAKKADSTYPIVSAASICAKVSRDHALQVWKCGEGLEVSSADFGSGYPGGAVFVCLIKRELFILRFRSGHEEIPKGILRSRFWISATCTVQLVDSG